SRTGAGRSPRRRRSRSPSQFDAVREVEARPAQRSPRIPVPPLVTPRLSRGDETDRGDVDRRARRAVRVGLTNLESTHVAAGASQTVAVEDAEAAVDGVVGLEVET